MPQFNTTVTYLTSAKTKVVIPSEIEPYKILQVPLNVSLNDLKRAFRRLIITDNRVERALVSISYAIIGSLLSVKTLSEYFKRTSQNPPKFTYDASHPIVMVYLGNCREFRSMIHNDRTICDSKCENSMSLLYIACRSGFRDLVTLLLKYGCCVNNNECGSTALHAACYFGHECVVSLLIENGASLTLKNKFGHPALEEARTDEIKKNTQ